ncbi:hypothetical protein [Glycomyces harbinensis]|uniref:Uncharacterized protein n=1 Tax=Glycomyces harbinensis TaxID=58114 RepID=A0A1G7B1D5_9ACTN|nr:hypothetical protein [Glycomyces harbinensis]SDE20752.1 hypothetical protein SAMN05216270_11573 [Glycomyces harbinensis]
MRRTLTLLLLIGIGLALRRGGDGKPSRPGDGGDGGTTRPPKRHGDIDAGQGTGSAQDAVDAEFQQGRAGTSRTDSSPANPDDRYTGGAVRPRANDYEGQDKWAAEAYERFRQNDEDVDAIAANTGLSREEVLAAKNNVMRDEHPIRDPYDGTLRNSRFDEDADIASAWNRLRTGNPNPPHESDLALLNHEVAEARYFRDNPGAEYAEAHQAANEASNWEQYVRDGNIPFSREDYTAPNSGN